MIQIKNRYDNKVIFEADKETIGEVIELAIEEKISLQYADLQDADLQGANLQYADLQGANLQYADLQYADLQGADLQYADLRGADLQGADLQDADLRSAKGTFMFNFGVKLKIENEY